MSENTKLPDPDVLEKALAAFREMSVPDRPPDQDLLTRLAALPEATVQPTPIPHSLKRRFYMRPTFHFATAASLLLAVGAWLLFSGGSSVALGDVIKAAEKYKLVKYKQTTEEEPAQTVYADLTGSSSRIEYREKSADGTVETLVVMISDISTMRSLWLYTDTEVATGKTIRKEGVMPVMHRGNPKPLGGIKAELLLDFLRELQAHKETKSDKVKLDGREVVKYGLKDEARSYCVWVDPRTKLPVRVEFDFPQLDGPRKWVCTDYEWDPKVENADKLFSTDPPPGYTIRDVANDPARKGEGSR